MGHFTTRPLRFKGQNLILNVEPAGPEAEMKVQLLSADGEVIPGYTFDDCTAITEDLLDAQIKWTGKDYIGPEISEKPVRLHFRFRNMRIYAFQFR